MAGMPQAGTMLVHQVPPITIAADITASTVWNIPLWQARPKAALAARVLLPMAGPLPS